MERVFPKKTVVVILFVLAVFALSAVFSVSKAEWRVEDVQVTAQGTVGKFYVDYPQFKSDGGGSATVKPARNLSKRSVRVDFTDGSVVFQLKYDIDSSLGLYFHIWAAGTNTTTWPGLSMNTSPDTTSNTDSESNVKSLTCSYKDVAGIIILNANGNDDKKDYGRTGDGDHFFKAKFPKGLQTTRYEIATRSFDEFKKSSTDFSKIQVYELGDPIGKTAADPLNVRNLSANTNSTSNTYRNYVCVSRVDGSATAATAYVDFKFDFTTPPTDAKIVSFTVKRTLTDADGIPQGKAMYMRIYNDPSGKNISDLKTEWTDKKNNPYTALDFGADTDRYYAMDITVVTSTALEFGVTATASNTDSHTYEQPNAFYLGIDGYVMREPMYICAIEGSMPTNKGTSAKEYNISTEVTLKKGQSFKLFGTGSDADGKVIKNKYFGVDQGNISFIPAAVSANFVKPTDHNGNKDSDIDVLVGGYYRIKYSGTITHFNTFDGISDYMFAKLEITLLDAPTATNVVNVTFDAGDGAFADGTETYIKTLRKNGTVLKPTGISQTITKEDGNKYIFDDWYTGQNGIGDKWDFTNPITADKILYAHYVQIYTITFKSEGKEDQEISTGRGGKLTKLPTEPTKDGWDFVGWEWQKTDGTTEKILQENLADYTFIGSITLDAKFDRVTVIFLLNHTDPDPENKTYATQYIKLGALPSRPVTDPTRADWEFKNWYSGPDCKTLYDFGTKYNAYGTYYVYAGWKSTNVLEGDWYVAGSFNGWQAAIGNSSYKLDNKTGSITLELPTNAEFLILKIDSGVETWKGKHEINPNDAESWACVDAPGGNLVVRDGVGYKHTITYVNINGEDRISVSRTAIQYKINDTVYDNDDKTIGTVSASKDTATKGESITLTVDITNTDKYEVDRIYYTDTAGNETDIDKSTKTFDMPAKDITVHVVFRERKITIKVKYDSATWGTTATHVRLWIYTTTTNYTNGVWGDRPKVDIKDGYAVYEMIKKNGDNSDEVTFKIIVTVDDTDNKVINEYEYKVRWGKEQEVVK